MKAIDRPFASIINGTSQFVIPVFQRDYTWQAEPQCSQLWKDVIRAAGKQNKNGHFLGSVVYIATGDSSAGFTKWLLIDGQQRLTTLTLLLIALRDFVKESGWAGGEGSPTAKRIDAYFLKNVQEEGSREQKLVLRRHDQATLKSLLNGEEMPAEPSERIRENYKYFLEQLASADPDEVYTGIARLMVVDVALDRQFDDPQLIFESLNSTGVDLSQSDLIRNFILMRLSETEQTKLYEGYWEKIEILFRGSERNFDSFARDYVALKTKSSKQEKSSEIYYAFRDFFPALVDQCGSQENALSDILRYARYYAAFSLGRGVSGATADCLASLRRLVDVPGLLVMRLMACCGEGGKLSTQDFVGAVSLIESYVMRRAICGFQTRGYWQVFASLAYSMRDASPYDDLKVELARQRDTYRFPNDESFMKALKESDLYGMRVCKHLLERLENYDTKEPSDTSSYSIEHIMPQNDRLRPEWRRMLGENWKDVQKKWLNRLGNLTLTAYNSKYSDRSFDEKKNLAGGFLYSSVRLNKFVRERMVWTDIEMVERTDQLAEVAICAWPALVVPQDLIDSANQRDMRDQASRRDISKLEMSDEARVLFECLRADVVGLDPNLIEIVEAKSVSYHSPGFFLEVLPRRYSLTLLLPLDFSQIEDLSGVAKDATQWQFFQNAQHEGGVFISLSNVATIPKALPLIRQSYAAAYNS